MPTVLLHDVESRKVQSLATAVGAKYRLLLADDSPPDTLFSAQILDITASQSSDRIAERVSDDPYSPVILLAPPGRVDLAVLAIRAGAFDVLEDPVNPSLLALTLERAVQHGAMLRELHGYRSATLRPQNGGLLGSSRAIRETQRLIDRIAAVDSSVLITGESGTGKELVARALHERSARRGRPFVAINCASVPEALLESELFGHLKGAFTDARANREGLFIQASGGTLFLDEIGDLSAPLQPKLLRVLQDRKVRPVGADQEVPVDVRILAATHQDLDARAEAGFFRSDLLYRLDVLRIELPALRERGTDILSLAHHFLSQHAAAMGRPTPTLCPAVAHALLEHPWPGNVRELQNAMERAAALASTDRVELADLPPRLLRNRPKRSMESADSPNLLTLDAVERAHVLHVLAVVSGQRTKAAKILGLDRKTLWRKLRGWGVED